MRCPQDGKLQACLHSWFTHISLSKCKVAPRTDLLSGNGSKTAQTLSWAALDRAQAFHVSLEDQRYRLWKLQTTSMVLGLSPIMSQFLDHHLLPTPRPRPLWVRVLYKLSTLHFLWMEKMTRERGRERRGGWLEKSLVFYLGSHSPESANNTLLKGCLNCFKQAF